LVGVLLGSRFGFLLRQVLCVCVGPAAVAVVLCAGVSEGNCFFPNSPFTIHDIFPIPIYAICVGNQNVFIMWSVPFIVLRDTINRRPIFHNL
jgi:hypothetical protein